MRRARRGEWTESRSLALQRFFPQMLACRALAARVGSTPVCHALAARVGLMPVCRVPAARIGLMPVCRVPAARIGSMSACRALAARISSRLACRALAARISSRLACRAHAARFSSRLACRAHAARIGSRLACRANSRSADLPRDRAGELFGSRPRRIVSGRDFVSICEGRGGVNIRIRGFSGGFLLQMLAFALFRQFLSGNIRIHVFPAVSYWKCFFFISPKRNRPALRSNRAGGFASFFTDPPGEFWSSPAPGGKS